MAERRTHYEIAFQSWLDRRAIPYVAVEDVRRFVCGRTGLKSFDYIIYPTGRKAYLVDVKGRKTVRAKDAGDWRQKTWVTRGDLVGLTSWVEIFGPEYEAAFVFAYWLAPPASVRVMATDDKSAPRVAGEPGARGDWELAGRRYSFWLVGLGEYDRAQRPLSKRWDTVSIPLEAFREMARPVEQCWPAGPC